MRPAWVWSAPQQSPPRPGQPDVRARGAHHPQRGAVHVALPRVHHAAREEVRVAGRSSATSGVRSERADSSGRPKRRGTRCRRWATRSTQVSGEENAVAREHDA